MSEKDKQTLSSDEQGEGARTKEFAPEDFNINPVSSAENVKTPDAAGAAEIGSGENALDAVAVKSATSVSNDESSARIENPVFRELAAPTLPENARENRARLQMQSPTRLYFYWSFRANPFDALRRIFGAAAKNYTLVVKLVDEKNGRAEVYPIQIEGSWWFDVDADSIYRAEIGFQHAQRPFARLMFSNRVETPRKNPSARRADAAEWTISADSFAEVLDNSGFSHDAFEVALAGDDFEFAENATKTAFAQMFGETENDRFNDNSSEMRFALLALAAGYAPENLRGQISRSLFARLTDSAADLTAEKAIAALRENFGVFADEDSETEILSPRVFGASLINFPRASKRRFSPKFTTFSSTNFKAKN